MFFGSYLVKEKIISINDFVDCLSAQVKSTPSLVEAVFSSEIISNDKLIELVDQQFDQKISLMEVIINSSIVTKEQLLEVVNLSVLQQDSFSNILINKNKMTVNMLKSHYEAYEKSQISTEGKPAEVEVSAAALESLKELDGVDLSELGVVEKSEEKTSQEPELSEAALESLRELNAGAADDLVDGSAGSLPDEKGPELSEAALESLRELSPDAAEGLEISSAPSDKAVECGPNETFKNEFCETFNETMYKKMNKIVKIIFSTVKEEGDFSNFFNSLFREFHLVKGASRLAGFKLVEETIDQWEDILGTFFKLEEAQKKEWFELHSGKLTVLIDSCWEIRNQINSNVDDASIDYSSVNKVLEDFLGPKMAS